MVHGLSLATITGRWLGETQFMQVRMMWALPCPATVHQRPCMTREMKTWLSDSRVGNNSVVQRRSRRPVLSPLRNCVDGCHVWQYIASRCKPWRWMLKDISICGWDSMIEAYCQYTVTMTTMNTTMTELSGGFSPTRHKTGHFGDVSPNQSLGLVWKKLNLTQRQKHTFTNQKKSSTTQNKHKN